MSEAKPMTFAPVRPRCSALCLVAAGIASASGCSGSPGATVSLPGLHDVYDAPSPIQEAAKAIVRVGTPRDLGTGAFISSGGLLMTNNHVLGVDVCPVDGCFVQVDFLFQRHSPPPKPRTLFAIPVAVDAGLDMAVLQIYDSPGGSTFSPPAHLTLASRSAASLVGSHVYVVGHPDGALKKWTDGQVVDFNGDWVISTAYILPGSSGSPFLDDTGHMVGIVHRGPTSQDLGSNTGVDEYSVGTASASLVTALKAPLPPDMYSVSGSKTDADVATHQALYLSSRTKEVMVNGVMQEVLTSLGNQCDAALMQTVFASPTDLANALAPCTDAVGWIECRSDAMTDFGVCPPTPSDWATRYAAVHDEWVAFNGQQVVETISFGDAALAGTEAAGLQTAQGNLTSAYSVTKTPLDFDMANVLAAFGVTRYQGTDLESYLRGYAMVPGYALSGTGIASAMVWLNHYRVVSGPDVVAFLKGLQADSKIDLGTKLYIEQVLYASMALD